jgi:hypothetical protein
MASDPKIIQTNVLYSRVTFQPELSMKVHLVNSASQNSPQARPLFDGGLSESPSTSAYSRAVYASGRIALWRKLGAPMLGARSTAEIGGDFIMTLSIAAVAGMEKSVRCHAGKEVTGAPRVCVPKSGGVGL